MASRVALRASAIRLAGLTSAEAADGIAQALGDAVAPEAAARIAASERARTWLDLHRVCAEVLAAALRRGERRADEQDALAVLEPRAAAAPRAPDAASLNAALAARRAA